MIFESRGYCSRHLALTALAALLAFTAVLGCHAELCISLRLQQHAAQNRIDVDAREVWREEKGALLLGACDAMGRVAGLDLGLAG